MNEYQKVLTKAEKKAIYEKELIEQSKSYHYQYAPKEIILNNNPEQIKKLTAHQCWRPDLYLDIGCHACALQEHCACHLRNKKKVRASKR